MIRAALRYLAAGVASLALGGTMYLGIALAGCTPAAQQTAGVAVSTIGSAAPAVCTPIDAADPSAASVCGPTSAAVSAVAQLVVGILKSLPPAAMRKGDAAATKVPLWVNGCLVMLPPAQAAAVQAKLGAAK